MTGEDIIGLIKEYNLEDLNIGMFILIFLVVIFLDQLIKKSV